MKITSFHIEASTHCNARCPGCPRNIHGYDVKDYFKLEHLSAQRYKEIRDAHPDLNYVRINGGLGDPMMNPAITEIVEISDCLVQITTNGSIGNRKTFERLAELETQIEFSIDGSPENFTEYRVNADWSSIKPAILTMVKSPATVGWKYIPFSFNEDSIEKTRQLSKDLGVDNFIIDPSDRWWGEQDKFKPANITNITSWCIGAKLDTKLGTKLSTKIIPYKTS